MIDWENLITKKKNVVAFYGHQTSYFQSLEEASRNEMLWFPYVYLVLSYTYISTFPKNG